MRWLTALSAIALLAYPLAVYYGLHFGGIKTVAGVLAVLFLVRMVGGKQVPIKELKYIAIISGGAGIILASLGWIFKTEGWFTFYPVIVNVVMFVMFFWSLFQSQSMIERFARLQEPDLPESGVKYTRTVTKTWCVFFIINGSISFSTCFMDMKMWMLYNGFISYLLIGTLFISEWLVRQWIRKKEV